MSAPVESVEYTEGPRIVFTLEQQAVLGMEGVHAVVDAAMAEYQRRIKEAK